jgi:hypothetical protein
MATVSDGSQIGIALGFGWPPVFGWLLFRMAPVSDGSPLESGVERGEWRVESGEWRVESGEWRVESGEWRVESGEWRVKSERPLF